MNNLRFDSLCGERDAPSTRVNQSTRDVNYVTRRFKAMGGPCEISILDHTEKAVDEIIRSCEDEVKRLEAKYSRFLETSVTSLINRSLGEPVEVDKETAGLLNYANIAFEQSDGLFDITSGVLRRVWDFKRKILPEESSLQEVLPLIGWDKVKWDGSKILIPKTMELDFGGLVKEYAADAAANLVKQHGVESGYVNLGGDISVVGPKTILRNGVRNARPWLFGIRDPDKPEQAIAVIEVNNGGLASSGDYERYFDQNGKRYCHIFNPKTGYPSFDMSGVSVHSHNCLTAGTLSTIAMLKGYQNGKRWLKENQVEHLVFERKV